MTNKTTHNLSRTVAQRANGWLPIVFRSVVALILTPAGVLKFLNHSEEVTAFASYGIPAPEITVLLVGVIEVAAAVSIAFGIVGRMGSLIIIPVMITAMLTAGVVLSNLVVFIGCLGILLVGTGDYAIFQPEVENLRRFTNGASGKSNQQP